MKVVFLFHGEIIELEHCPPTLGDALDQLDIEKELVLAVRDGQMILADECLQEGNIIRLVPTYPGG